jgi:predicted metal-dependent hydrolase
MKRSYARGDFFLYRGKTLRLEILERPPHGAGQKAALSESGSALLVNAASLEDRKRAILFFYTARTEEIVRAMLPAWAKKLAVRPRSVEVRHVKTRWGSCSTSGKLFFNSRVSMLSDDVAEYIIVHELCHLKQMNHGKAFWDCVRSALPGCMALRRRLREQERDAVL